MASIDAKFSQWFASIRTQEGKKEIVEELEDTVFERLEAWQSKNGQLPNTVRYIVYRDGMFKGQYPVVLTKEYPSFVTAFRRKYRQGSRHHNISIIVVVRILRLQNGCVEFAIAVQSRKSAIPK